MALSKILKLAMQSGAKQTAKKATPQAAQKELKRIMYTKQELTDTLGGEFRVFEGLEELPSGAKRPIKGDDISNLNSSFISIESPPGAKFRNQAELLVDPELSAELPVGNPVKGAKTVMTNLIDSKGQWKWVQAPEGYEDNTFLVAMKGGAGFTPQGADHAYTLKTIYEKGGNMTTYDTRAKAFRDKSLQESEAMLEEALARLDDSKLRGKAKRDLRGDNPRGKPTTTGIPEFGPVVGMIETSKKKKHPVYEYVIMRAEGGSVGRVERNPYGDYQKLI